MRLKGTCRETRDVYCRSGSRRQKQPALLTERYKGTQQMSRDKQKVEDRIGCRAQQKDSASLQQVPPVPKAGYFTIVLKMVYRWIKTHQICSPPAPTARLRNKRVPVVKPESLIFRSTSSNTP